MRIAVKRLKLFRSCALDETPLYFYQVSLVIAAELVLAFSAAGYITIAPISITFVTLPVLFGALLFGPLEGMILGGVFGLTSIWKASITAVAYSDSVFSPFVSGQPLPSLLLGLGDRMLFGLAAGYFYLLAKRKKYGKKAAIVTATLVSLFFHSFLVHWTMEMLFPETGIRAVDAVFNSFTFGNAFNWSVIAVLVVLFYQLGKTKTMQMMKENLRRIERIQGPQMHHGPILLFSVIISLIAFGLLLHFFGRTELLLSRHAVPLPEELDRKLFQVGLQFLTAIFALTYLMMVIVVYFEKYSRELFAQSERDTLTGLYHRGAVVKYVKRRLAERTDLPGAFLMIDIDNFKGINDRYGHPAGDLVLQEIAKILREYFGDLDIVGRLGGDEFVVFSDHRSLRRKSGEILTALCERVKHIRVQGKTCVSCSIGVTLARHGSTYEQIYQQADEALYQTKEKGKNGFTFYGG